MSAFNGNYSGGTFLSNLVSRPEFLQYTAEGIFEQSKWIQSGIVQRNAALDARAGGTRVRVPFFDPIATSNSYITVADATVYFDNRLDATDWTAATADNKAASLITATSWIDTLDFYGDRSATTQALKWPRTDITCDGIEATAAFIPREIKDVRS